MSEPNHEQQDVSRPPADPSFDSWLTRNEVARALGISFITVRRKQAAGELVGQLVNGQWRFPPEEVEALASELESERGSKPLDAQGLPSAATETGSEARTLFGAAVSLARQAEAHNERLITLLEAPASRLLQQTTAEAGALRQRIAQLEEKYTALLEASQAALDRAHERQLATQEQQAKLALRFEALGVLKQWAPLVAGKVMAGRGDARTAVQVLVEGLVSSLSPEQMMKLFEGDVLTDVQRVMLVNLAEAIAAASAPKRSDATAGRPLNGPGSDEAKAPNEGEVAPAATAPASTSNGGADVSSILDAFASEIDGEHAAAAELARERARELRESASRGAPTEGSP